MAFALLDSLVEAIVVGRRLLPAETNRKQAARNRRFVERWFLRHADEEPVPATQELLTFAFWKAECLEDPALAERFETSLPGDTLARALHLVNELRHVHPLAVREEPETWTCRACGESFARIAAVAVTSTGEELGYEDDLTYCLGCLSIATSALETTLGIDRFTEALDDARHGLRPPSGPPPPVVGGEPEASADEVVLPDEDDDVLILDDEETVRHEAERLTLQLEASERRMAVLESRRATLLRRLEESARRRSAAGDETSG